MGNKIDGKSIPAAAAAVLDTRTGARASKHVALSGLLKLARDTIHVCRLEVFFNSGNLILVCHEAMVSEN